MNEFKDMTEEIFDVASDGYWDMLLNQKRLIHEHVDELPQ